MSRIDELIRELCADGVRHVALSEVADYSSTRVDAADLDETTFVGVDNLVAEKGGRVDASYPPNTARLTAYEAGDILLGNIRPYLKKVWRATNEGGCSGDVLAIRIKRETRAEVESEFLYYLLSSDAFFAYNMQHAKGAKMPRGNKAAILNYRIPVPPLEVQREIVRILDKFTQLEAELEAELEARRAQYQHYLHSAVLPDGDIEWTTLGEAALNHDRKRKPVTRADRQGGEYPYYGANGVQDYVHDYIFDGTFLLVGEDGSVKNADGTPILNWASGKIWVNNHAHVLTAAGEHFNLRYLYYYLATVDVTIYVTGGTQPKINQSNLNKIPVPLVPRSFQDDIVGVLDRFDALVNDISVGLPAELNGLFGHPVGSWGEAAGGEEHAESVVLAVAETASEAAV